MARLPDIPGQLALRWEQPQTAQSPFGSDPAPRVVSPSDVDPDLACAPVDSVSAAQVQTDHVSNPSFVQASVLDVVPELITAHIGSGVEAQAGALAAPSVRDELAPWLSRSLGCAVSVSFVDRRRTLVSYRKVSGGLSVRAHSAFRESDEATRRALLEFVRGAQYPWIHQALRVFARGALTGHTPRSRKHVTVGQNIDLQQVLAATVKAFFGDDDTSEVAITWGQRSARTRRRRSIRLGTYSRLERLIRIHPILDLSWVPRFFVEFVVFHELLHHVEREVEHAERTIFHTSRFRERERAHPDYQRAIAWEKSNIDRLLRE